MVRRNLPGAVWALGFASLFMDISSELVHSVLPVFLVTTLGIGIATVGLIEGIAEATAAIVKVFAGALSDYIGRRKPLIVLGYGLAMLTKPLFPLASGATLVITARFIDRVGKGIRGAPRDALITDVTAPDQRGAAFGLRQTLDSVGAFVGPLLALGLMVWMATDIRGVLWLAALPALVSVGCIVVFVHEQLHARNKGGQREQSKSNMYRCRRECRCRARRVEHTVGIHEALVEHASGQRDREEHP